MSTTHKRPIILTTSEVRQLQNEGRLLVHRGLRRRPGETLETDRHPRYGRVGDQLYVREDVAVRLDGSRLKLRFRADPPDGQAKWVELTPERRRFANRRYRTWPARHAPKWSSRLTVRIACIRVWPRGAGAVAAITLELVHEETPAGQKP